MEGLGIFNPKLQAQQSIRLSRPRKPPRHALSSVQHKLRSRLTPVGSPEKLS